MTKLGMIKTLLAFYGGRWMVRLFSLIENIFVAGNIFTTSDAIVQPGEPTQWNAHPTIHFTVRILMSARKQDCHLLSRYSTILHNGKLAWVDVTQTRGFYEGQPTNWETWMFRQWIQREEQLFGNDTPSTGNERFTRFLYPFRHEGDHPRKAFYTPVARASSTERSRKIQDMDDMVAEAAKKGPDLSQSRSSAGRV